MTTAVKSKPEFLGQYAEGWTKGFTQLILDSTDPNYTFGDPDGRVGRDQFAAYHADFINKYGSEMVLSGVVSYEVGDKLVACCVWEAGGLRGTGLITVGNQGVEREDVVLL